MWVTEKTTILLKSERQKGAGIRARIAGLELTPDYTIDAADLKATGKDMDVLIYKTALMVEKFPDWLTLGDAVELRMLEGGSVAAYALSKERWIFLFGKRRLVRIGTLGEQTANLLRPTLARNSHLRVRIVELTTSKLSGDKRARISVSVWGDTKVLVPKSVEPFPDQRLA